jgi:hypothetical protein
MLAWLAGKREITEPLAGKSTLNRLELVPPGSPLAERYHKITYSAAAIGELLVEIFLEAHRKPPGEIVLDLDATDTPLHGRQEGRFFHGYYNLYCARGEMENRIKEQLSLFSDRLSTETLRANQLRLYFSSLAYVLVHALRRRGLRGTQWATAQVETIQLRLLKIAAQVRVTARRVWLCYSSAYPWKHVFVAAWSALRC